MNVPPDISSAIMWCFGPCTGEHQTEFTCWNLNWGRGCELDLRLCEGVIKANRVGCLWFSGPTGIFNSLCKGLSVGVGNNSNKPRHFMRLEAGSFRLQEGSSLQDMVSSYFL